MLDKSLPSASKLKLYPLTVLGKLVMTTSDSFFVRDNHITITFILNHSIHLTFVLIFCYNVRTKTYLVSKNYLAKQIMTKCGRGKNNTV